MNLFPGIEEHDNMQDCLHFVKSKRLSAYEKLVNRISKVDLLILNGEGTLIFQSPPRKDLLIYLVILQACIDAGKPFYVLNAMFTPFADEPLNVEFMGQAITILEKAEMFGARDYESYRFISQYGKNINAKYIPDALFTWFICFRATKIILNTHC